MGDRQGESQALALSLRQSVGATVGQILQIERGERLVHPLAALASRNECEGGPVLEMPSDGDPRIQTSVAGGQEPDSAVIFAPALGRSNPVDHHDPAVRAPGCR